MTEEAAPEESWRTPDKDEVLHCVGRNVVIFQEVEDLLKILVKHARFLAPMSQFTERFEEHTESLTKRTMGNLAGRLVDTVLDANSSGKDGGEWTGQIDEPWLGFSFAIKIDAESNSASRTRDEGTRQPPQRVDPSLLAAVADRRRR